MKWQRQMAVALCSVLAAAAATTGIWTAAESATAATPVTITVPAQEPTIQAAIDAATSGDTIVVSPGTYVGGITFDGKAITVKSAAGPTVTTIAADPAGGPGVVFDNGEGPSSVLQGFTVTGAKEPTGNGQSSGIYIDGSPLILGNIVSGNDYCLGAGIEVGGGSPIIDGNVVSHNFSNQCEPSYGAIFLATGSTASVVDNVVEYNNVDGIDGPASLLVDNIVLDNQGIGIHDGDSGIVAQNLVVGNLIGIDLIGIGTNSTTETVNNTLANNIEAQIYLGGSSSVVNNILVGPFAASPIQCNSVGTPAPTVSHNDIWSPSTPATSGSCPALDPAAGNISANPDFTASYQLGPASPALGAETTSAPFVFTTDLLQQPRTQNGKIDMGAFERQPSEPILAARSPTVRNVPAEYPTIQQAIDAAADGDEVLVAPGTYRGGIDFEGKNIVLASSGGPKVTTLDAPGASAGISFENGESRDAVLAGFTLGADAISIFNASPSIVGNIIDVDTVTASAAIQIQGAPLVAGNIIYGTIAPGVNTASGIAGETFGGAVIGNVIADALNGISLSGGSPILVADNLIASNRTGINITFLGQAEIIQNAIAANGEGVAVIGVVIGAAPSSFTSNTIVDNTDSQLGVPSNGSVFVTDNILQGPNPIPCVAGNAIPVVTHNGIVPAAGTTAVGACFTNVVPAGNIAADPAFTPGTLIPGSTSPCVDVGTLSGVLALPTDIAGRPRVVVGRLDLGAFEHQG